MWSGDVMSKTRYFIIFVVAIFTIFLLFQYNKNEVIFVNKDAIKFKEEYEKLNNKENPNNKKLYPSVDINKDNPIKYSNYDEVLEILKSGTGVIYFGSPNSALSRILIVPLLTSAEESEVETIYYMNLEEEAESLMLDDKLNVVIEHEGTKGYFKLVSALDSILSENILISADGDKVSTGKKKIEMPTVVFVKDGEIVGYHVGTVDSHEDPYTPLDDRQSEELLMKLINLCSVVKGTVCDERC